MEWKIVEEKVPRQGLSVELDRDITEPIIITVWDAPPYCGYRSASVDLDGARAMITALQEAIALVEKGT